MKLTRVASKHMYCDKWCNFDAGAGPYIDPSRRVLFYGTEHGSEALGLTFPPAVKLREFAP